MLENKEEILIKIRKLKEHFDKGEIPTLSEHEVKPGLNKDDRLNYLYFTLPVCLNFQRSSPAMWQAALKTFEDSATSYLFYPEKVVEQSRDKIMEDLLKHRLGLQRNKHTDIWIRISQTLNKYFDNDPRGLITRNDNDVVKILKLIRQDQKRDFPYLSGPKMSNYWLYILHKFTDVELANMNMISIIPDTHVIQSSVILGIINGMDINSDKISDIWKELLDGTEIIPVDMHPVLWNWSRNNFKPEV